MGRGREREKKRGWEFGATAREKSERARERERAREERDRERNERESARARKRERMRAQERDLAGVTDLTNDGGDINDAPCLLLQHPLCCLLSPQQSPSRKCVRGRPRKREN